MILMDISSHFLRLTLRKNSNCRVKKAKRNKGLPSQKDALGIPKGRTQWGRRKSLCLGKRGKEEAVTSGCGRERGSRDALEGGCKVKWESVGQMAAGTPRPVEATPMGLQVARSCSFCPHRLRSLMDPCLPSAVDRMPASPNTC